MYRGPDKVLDWIKYISQVSFIYAVRMNTAGTLMTFTADTSDFFIMRAFDGTINYVKRIPMLSMDVWF